MSKQKQKQVTWGGRFSAGPAVSMLAFSESISFDHRLAPFDVLCSKAHASMLCHVGLITQREREAILKGLDGVLDKVKEGKMVWDPKLEDIHMHIEQALVREVPAAAKLHTARSRNDQVATDMRLFFKWACGELQSALADLQRTLLELAERNQGVYIPGYTHLQRAQPVSIAHHLLAYIEMFSRDYDRFVEVSDHANWCPLGSGAIAGTTLPIDREYTAKWLGFVDNRGRARVTQNSMDAVADRDLFIEFAAACALTGVHFSRVAEDMILWSSAEFRFIDLPEAFTTGSSLMPQKKNPDALELIRGKAARLQGNLQVLFSLLKGLPFTYNRDLQEDKPPVFDSFDQTCACLEILKETLRGVQFKEDYCAAAVRDSVLLATDLVDYLVERGIPFREAHHRVGAVVALAERKGVGIHQLDNREVRSIDKHFGDDWKGVFDLETALKKRNQTGMPSPSQVKRQLRRWKKKLDF